MPRRAAISNFFTPSDNFQAPFHHKTDNEKAKIGEMLRHHVLFQDLLEADLQIIINAMFIKKVKKGEIVIAEGDDGSFFYIVDNGVFESFVQENGQKTVTVVLESSACFGETGLLYDLPSTSSVVALTEGTLWALDKATYLETITKTEKEKRRIYTGTIERIPFFMKLTEDEKERLTDALVGRTYEDGECIFREGEPGDGMYIVVSGNVVIRRRDTTGAQTEVELCRLTRGDYFGEVALITKGNRLASAYASGSLHAAFLEVDAFERLLGPCIEVMKDRFDDYEQQLRDMFGPEINLNLKK